MRPKSLRAYALPLLNVLAVSLFVAWDLRDLYLKFVWLGPYNAFAFESSTAKTIEHTSFAIVWNESQPIDSGDPWIRSSGWSSFFDRCASLHAMEGDQMDLVLANDCALGILSNQLMAPHLVLSSSVRVDSVAWASCKLLYLDRRPPSCQENMVTEFLERYHLRDHEVPPEQMADPNSDAEKELHQMLDLIGKSHPLTTMVCVEGFQVGGPGHFPPSLYGCASGSVFQSAFVGLHATSFVQLHAEHAWLTVDSLSVFGLEYVIRQNAKSKFTVHNTVGHGETKLSITQDLIVNFASFGHLCLVLLAIDVYLMVTHVHSALETADLLLLSWRGPQNPEIVDETLLWAALYRSLYRSKLVMWFTLASTLLSWQLMLPNSVLWTAGTTSVYLSTLRVWMLLAVVINWVWDFVTLIAEKAAYKFIKRTYVTVWEVMGIGMIMALIQLPTILQLAETKHLMELQRLVDTTSFPGKRAYSNAFNEDLDYLLSTPRSILSLVYHPLWIILISGVVTILVYASLKLLVFSMLPSSKTQQDMVTTGEYHRLPLEDLLQLPIRAQCLVRHVFSIEIVQDDQVYVRPLVYYDVGLIYDNGLIRTRRGFLGVIPIKMDVHKCFEASTSDPSPTMAENNNSRSSSSSSRHNSQATAAAPVTITSTAGLILKAPRPRQSVSVLTTDALAVPTATYGGAVAVATGKVDEVSSSRHSSLRDDSQEPSEEADDQVGVLEPKKSMRRRKSTTDFTVLQ